MASRRTWLVAKEIRKFRGFSIGNRIEQIEGAWSRSTKSSIVTVSDLAFKISPVGLSHFISGPSARSPALDEHSLDF